MLAQHGEPAEPALPTGVATSQSFPPIVRSVANRAGSRHVATVPACDQTVELSLGTGHTLSVGTGDALSFGTAGSAHASGTRSRCPAIPTGTAIVSGPNRPR